MANGLDRLERLFAYKRKASPSPSRGLDSLSQPLEQQFPSPSFIRPRTSRMTAREETHLRQAAGRSPSVPDVSSRSIAHAQEQRSGSTDGACKIQRKPVQSTSCSRRQREKLVDGLREFKFPKPPSCDSSISVGAIGANSFTPIDGPGLPSPVCHSPLEASIPFCYRLDTPPSSDSEDNASSSLVSHTKGRHVILPHYLPTPEQSPEMPPVSNARLRNVKSADELDKALYKAIEDQLGESFDQVSLGRSYSQSSIAASAHSFCSSILREPDVHEFLNLSDDDIAESHPPSPSLGPSEVDSSSLPHMGLSFSSEPLGCALLTLTPPRAGQPAAAAAFEAARIARRYDFDLVYAVNLWPGKKVPPTTDDADITGKPMLGRLLAAHGLHTVPSPLQISSEVHKTILRSDGWIEYQNQGATSRDLARGYACAFHTGQYTRDAPSRNNSLVSGVRLSQQIDRGIVFAAYRKPRDGDGKLGRSLGEEELGQLHRDAETLIEMVIDIHVADRNRRPPTRASGNDETGPIPMQADGS